MGPSSAGSRRRAPRTRNEAGSLELQQNLHQKPRRNAMAIRNHTDLHGLPEPKWTASSIIARQAY